MILSNSRKPTCGAEFKVAPSQNRIGFLNHCTRQPGFSNVTPCGTTGKAPTGAPFASSAMTSTLQASAVTVRGFQRHKPALSSIVTFFVFLIHLANSRQNARAYRARNGVTYSTCGMASSWSRFSLLLSEILRDFCRNNYTTCRLKSSETHG